jgi:hypothetical protein
MSTHLSIVVQQTERHVRWFALHLLVDACSSEPRQSSRSPAGERLRVVSSDGYIIDTLAYSFVDKDKLFLRPTIRGRGVKGSIGKVARLASRGTRLSSRLFTHARPQHL